MLFVNNNFILDFSKILQLRKRKKFIYEGGSGRPYRPVFLLSVSPAQASFPVLGGHVPTEHFEHEDGLQDSEVVCQLPRECLEQLKPVRGRILRHLRYDEQAGKYVSTRPDRRMKALQVRVAVDKEQYHKLSGTQSSRGGASGGRCQPISSRRYRSIRVLLWY